MPISTKNKGTWLVIDRRRVGPALLAPLAVEAGYDLSFAHFDSEVARYYEREGKYRVRLSYPDAHTKEILIDNFSSFSFTDMVRLHALITASTTRVVSLSIYPADYKKVVPLLAASCVRRLITQQKLIVVLVEKTTRSRERFFHAVSKAEITKILDRVVVVEALSDCIIPQYPPFSPVIFREAYGELWIEDDSEYALKSLGTLSHTARTLFLDAYREQKFFGLNGLQVSAAIIGDAMNVYTVDVALRLPILTKFFMRMHRDRVIAMGKLVPHFSQKEHSRYLGHITTRLKNIHFTDTTNRLLSNLTEKLNAKERLVRVALVMPESTHLSCIIALGIAHLRRMNRRYAESSFEKTLDTVVRLPSTPEAEKLRNKVIADGNEISQTSPLRFIERVALNS